jgi:DNA primase catalytic core
MITNKDTIIESASIVDIIGKFVSLEKRGASHVGLCPFHKEKTPSFNVSETKGIYKCFGCDASGDAVQFLMDNQGMTFPESLEYIAQFTNVEPEYATKDQRPEITRKKKQEKKEKQQLLDAMAQVGQIFWENSSLKANENDEVLISERVYKKGTIERFRVCLPPTGLFSKDLNTDILQKIGVLNAHGKDFFFDRILFPIQDYKGQLVGFAGRTTQNDNAGTPKYINTKDTPIYKKEGVLYGLHQAKRAIRSTDLAIVTEGYTDVLTLHENGFENSVATCGTAFTEKQARLLKKYTKNILLLRDGDEAGRKATIRDVETAVRAGLNPRICILENKEDPDSLVRKHKGPGFRELLNDKEQDGIIWRVMEEWSDSNNFQKEKAIETAGELLSYLSEPMQETYLRDLCQKKRMGAIKITLRKVIKRKSDARLKTQKLDTQQIEDIVNYGIYEKGRRYFISTDHENGRGYSISNFTIKPLLLIIGANYSLRLIEIINVFGRSAILNLESSAMTSMTDFKRAVEGKGNFVFSGKANAYDRVKAKVYRDFVDCFPINTMGQHREGFYTWGNGISIDGQFKSIDENGIVIHNETKYFLPAFSRIQEKIKSDDMEEEFEFEKKWCYHSTPKAISFEEWSRRMVEVHGTNGGIAVSFYLASLYRDIIFSKFNFFPILNHFGPSGSGKSFCAQSVMAMFGKGDQHDPFNLSSGTNVAFFRRLAQVRNGVVFFDEYSNNVDHRRIEAIKGSYDGAGRQKGVASTDNRTVTTKIRAALLVAGQEQATKDIASFKRMVSLNFKRGTNSLAQQIAAEKLKDLEKTGSLTQITQKLLTYREWVAQEFRDHFIAVKKIFTEAIQKDGHNIEDRLLNNHLIFLTIAVVINKKEKFGFDMEDLSAWIFKNMITQAESIRNEDELSIFWRIFDYLVQSNQACDGKDFCVEMQDSETYLDPSSKVRKDNLLKDYGKPKSLLYLTFSKVHPDYQERHQRQRSKNGLDLQALLYYLTNSDAYEGKKKAKRIGKRVKTVYVFDTDKLPIQIDLSTKEEF